MTITSPDGFSRKQRRKDWQAPTHSSNSSVPVHHTFPVSTAAVPSCTDGDRNVRWLVHQKVSECSWNLKIKVEPSQSHGDLAKGTLERLKGVCGIEIMSTENGTLHRLTRFKGRSIIGTLQGATVPLPPLPALGPVKILKKVKDSVVERND